MAERNFTDGDVKALGKEIANAIRSGGGSGGGGGGGGSGGGGTSTGPSKEASNTFNSMMKDSADAANKVTAAYNKVAPGIETGLNTWRDLSKVGAGFSNDIVGMTAAAAGTRMPLGEFAGVIKDNAASLSGFGGNVTRGAEEFSRLSKKMFDDYAPNTDQLIQMGIANKDLNELLMIQSVSTRSKMKDGDEKDRKLIENAMALGTEMDLMAKLTGKSREAQMEQQRKNQQDMAFEAAIRRKTQGMSADDAMEFEKNARNQLRDAQMRGQEAVFKDVFATGTIKSKEAAAQASINQEQASATMKQAQVSADKTMDAKERERQANVAAAEGRRAFDKDMQNDTKLMYASLGDQGGTVGKVMRDSMGANIEYQRNLEATATKMGIVMKTDEDRAKVQKQMEEDAKSAAAGKKADGTQGDATTKALVNLGARAGDVESAFMNKIVKPLNEQVNPAFNKLAEGALGATKKGATETRVNAAERELDEGAAGKTTTGLNKLSGARVETGNIVNQLAGVKTQPKPIPEKALGGPVEEGEPYIVGDGGEEEIFVPKTAGEIIPKSMLSPKGLGSRSQNMEGAYKSMQSMDPAKMFADLKAKTSGGGINFNEISKDISTTISGGGSSSIKLDAAAIADMTKPFEKSFKDFNSGFKNVITTSSKEITSAPFAESFDEFGSNFDDVVASLGKQVGGSIPTDMFNEFGSNFDDVVASLGKQVEGSIPTDMFDELGKQIDGSIPTDMFDEFGDNFDDVVVKMNNDVADAMGGSNAEAAQAKIDEAIAEKQKALDKITYMLNEVSDEDFDQTAWDEAIAERDAAQEKLDKVIEESISDLAGGFDNFSDNWEESLDKVSADITDAIPYDEFGGLDEAIARNQADDKQRAEATSGAMQEVVTGSSPAKLDRGITTDSFTLGPNGLPIAKPKSTAAAVPEKKNEGKTAEEQVKEREEQAKADMAKGDKGEKSIKKEGSDSKGATLDDLLKSMNALNTKVGQLISVNEDGHKASAKAAKSNNANLYTR